MRIAILGGTGAMGKFLARLLLKDGFDVVISGSRPEKARIVAEEVGCEPAPDNVSAVKDADVVVVSVPISITERVIEEVGSHLEPGTLITDVTSVKVGPVEAMLKHTSEEIHVLGTHPLFGPTVPSLRGQTVVLTPTERSGPWTNKIRRYLEDKGAKVVVTSPEDHDKVMAVVQCLTHAILWAAGGALPRLLEELDPELDPETVASPVYRLLLDTVGRIVGQDPRLYAEIQSFNPYGKAARRELLRALEEIDEKAPDHGLLADLLAEFKEELSYHVDTNRSQLRTDKLLSYLSDEAKVISEGMEATLVEVYTGKVVEGRVLEDDGGLAVGDLRVDRDEWKVYPRLPKSIGRTEGSAEMTLLIEGATDPHTVTIAVEAIGRNVFVSKTEKTEEGVRIKVSGRTEEDILRTLEDLRGLGLDVKPL